MDAVDSVNGNTGSCVRAVNIKKKGVTRTFKTDTATLQCDKENAPYDEARKEKNIELQKQNSSRPAGQVVKRDHFEQSVYVIPARRGESDSGNLYLRTILE